MPPPGCPKRILVEILFAAEELLQPEQRKLQLHFGGTNGEVVITTTKYAIRGVGAT